jgi:hypothetical protein
MGNRDGRRLGLIQAALQRQITNGEGAQLWPERATVQAAAQPGAASGSQGAAAREPGADFAPTAAGADPPAVRELLTGG